MCGISGLISPSLSPEVRREAVSQMCDAMVHRGPDDSGISAEGDATLGMRRLAIFDPANGRQPMQSPGGRLTLVFNGAIYNFRDLRRQLAGTWEFRTECDTEVLLAAFARWGEACLPKLRGMFAFAIWDRETRCLFLARDAFGVKPLYYRELPGGGLVFASEIRALNASGAGSSIIDATGVADYLAWMAVPAPRTIYRDIRSLRPGEAARFRGGRLEIAAGWRFSTIAPPERICRTREEFVGELRSRLEDSVRAHSLADVPVGAFLSGGLDSASVVALMNRSAGGWLKTFTVDFGESGFSEAKPASETARFLGTEHRTLTLSGTDLARGLYRGILPLMRRRYTTFTLLLLDVVCGVGVFNLALLLRSLPGGEDFLLGSLILPLGVTMIALYLVDGYSPRCDMLSADYASQHLVAFGGATLVVLLFTHALLAGGYPLQTSRLVTVLAMIAYAAVSLGYRRTIQLRRLERRAQRSLLFIGDGPSLNSFSAECGRTGLGLRLHALETDASQAGAHASLSEKLAELDRNGQQLEAIVIRESASGVTESDTRRLTELHFARIPTLTLELFYQQYWRRIPPYRLNPTWLFQEEFKVAREPVYLHLKRLSDIALSLIGLAIAAPFIAVAMLAIRWEDRGPAFFAQTRVGFNQRRFRIFKLRTMSVDAGGGPLYTQPGDRRITRVGAFLRNSRLDELPQLWNVLRGDMSLIGPRAEWERLVESYEREIPCYHFRHLVKPGITGWAQVNYPYGASLEDTARKLEYDLYYIRHFSFTLDAAIVLKTIHTVLGGKGR